MSLRERLLIASSLILGLSAVGCGDGDDAGIFGDRDRDGGETPEMDAGKPSDAGKTDSGKTDGGDAGTTKFPTMACGSNTCEGNLINNMLVDPCCVPDETGAKTSTCGFDADDIKKANPSSPFTGCVPRDVPAASASTYCGEFWDQVEMAGGDNTNGGLDIASGRVMFVFDGCCLPSGECGAQIDTPRMQSESINSHLGCVSYGRLNAALNGADAGMSAPPAKLPFCNPADGTPPTGDAVIRGYPKFVCGCGENKLDDHTGTFPCFNNLPTTVCGADAPTADQLAMIPEFICGCPADISKARLPCMRNLADSVCGAKQIDATSTELAKIPVFVCGHDAAAPTPLPTLKGVDTSVCGTKAVEPGSTDLALVPAFICGVTQNPDTTLPKLRNLPATTCGGLPVTTGNPYLDQIPEFICGAVGLTSAPTLPVLRNVDKSVCGGKQIDANSAELALVPEFICGATGATAQTAGLPHLANVEAAVCGKKPIDADSAELNLVPVFVCGAEGGTYVGLPQLPGVANAVCGKKPITQDSTELDTIPAFICGAVGRQNIGLPQLRNVAGTICGELPITTGSPYLATIPEFLCGCTGRVDPKLGCLSNVANDVCGAAPIDANSAVLANIPKFVCGCTNTGLDTELGSLCMSNVESSVCGSRADAVTDRGAPGLSPEDCLTGVPEYAGGCGGIETPAGQRCLRQTPALPGCDNVASGPIPRLPEYACGCGESATSPATGIPCLNFVATNICGAIAIPAAAIVQAQLPTLRVTVCGCGDGTLNSTPAQSLPCLPNIPTDWCGTVAAGINPVGGAGSTPCAVGYPAVFHGCAAPGYDTAYPIQCIANVAETVFGCP